MLLFQLAVVWLRTPFLPAACSGDEVWFSESGYYLLNEGLLKRPMFADAMGSAVHDMYPPMIAIGQCASFAIFGVNAFGMMAISSVAFTATVLLFYLNCRRLVSCNIALLATLALLGPAMIERHILSVRPETLIPPLFLAFLYVWSSPNRERWLGSYGFLAGLFASLACICYYPQSPFVLIGILLIALPSSRKEFKSFGWFLAGSSLVLVAVIIWIGVYWDYFYSQVIDLGHKYYPSALSGLVPASVLNSLPSVSRSKGLINNLAWGEFVGLFALTVHVAIKNFRENQFLTRLSLAALAGLAPIFFIPYPEPLMLLHGAVLGLYILAVSWQPSNTSLTNLCIATTLSILAMVSSLKTVTMLSVVELEKSARSYAPIEGGITATVCKPGKIGFTQRAWLALRKTHGVDDIHFMVDYLASPQCTELRSLVLRDSKYLPEFSYFVIEHAQLERLQTAYPLLRGAIESGEFVELARITAPKLNISITKSEPYNIVIFGRKPSRL